MGGKRRGENSTLMYSIQAFIIYYPRLILYCSMLFYLEVAETQSDQGERRVYCPDHVEGVAKGTRFLDSSIFKRITGALLDTKLSENLLGQNLP